MDIKPEPISAPPYIDTARYQEAALLQAQMHATRNLGGVVYRGVTDACAADMLHQFLLTPEAQELEILVLRCQSSAAWAVKVPAARAAAVVAAKRILTEVLEEPAKKAETTEPGYPGFYGAPASTTADVLAEETVDPAGLEVSHLTDEQVDEQAKRNHLLRFKEQLDEQAEGDTEKEV